MEDEGADLEQLRPKWAMNRRRLTIRAKEAMTTKLDILRLKVEEGGRELEEEFQMARDEMHVQYQQSKQSLVSQFEGLMGAFREDVSELLTEQDVANMARKRLLKRVIDSARSSAQKSIDHKLLQNLSYVPRKRSLVSAMATWMQFTLWSCRLAETSSREMHRQVKKVHRWKAWAKTEIDKLQSVPWTARDFHIANLQALLIHVAFVVEMPPFCVAFQTLRGHKWKKRNQPVDLRSPSPSPVTEFPSTFPSDKAHLHHGPIDISHKVVESPVRPSTEEVMEATSRRGYMESGQPTLPTPHDKVESGRLDGIDKVGAWFSARHRQQEELQSSPPNVRYERGSFARKSSVGGLALQDPHSPVSHEMAEQISPSVRRFSQKILDEDIPQRVVGELQSSPLANGLPSMWVDEGVSIVSTNRSESYNANGRGSETSGGACSQSQAASGQHRSPPSVRSPKHDSHVGSLSPSRRPRAKPVSTRSVVSGSEGSRRRSNFKLQGGGEESHSPRPKFQKRVSLVPSPLGNQSSMVGLTRGASTMSVASVATVDLRRGWEEWTQLTDVEGCASPSRIQNQQRPSEPTEGVTRWPLTSPVFPPSGSIGSDSAFGELPHFHCSLDHMFGFISDGFRDNVRFSATGWIVYHIGKVAVVYNPSSFTQKPFKGHTETITCLAVNNSGSIVATGQYSAVQSDGLICVWDPETIVELWRLDVTHQSRNMGISSLSFSPDSCRLLSTGSDPNHTVTVWDLADGSLLKSSRVGSEKILACGFNQAHNLVVVCGVRHISFYGDSTLRQKPAVLGYKGGAVSHLCMAFSDNGLTLTGTHVGSVFVWEGSELVSKVSTPHSEREGPYRAILCMCWDKGGLISGGKDGSVTIYDRSISPLRSIPVSKHPIRSLHRRVGTSRVVAAAGDGKILSLNQESLSVTAVTRGFAPRPSGAGGMARGGSYQVAIAQHPTAHILACGDGESHLQFLDTITHRLHYVETLFPASTTAITKLCFSPSGSTLAVGTSTGDVVVYPLSTGSGGHLKIDDAHQPTRLRKLNGQKACADVTALNYSRDGTYIAVAYADTGSGVVIFKDEDRVTVCNNPETIIRVDWSTSGDYLQACSSGGAGLYHWAIPSGSAVASGGKTTRDVPWDTWTSLVGWPCLGVWDDVVDGRAPERVVTCVVRSHNHKLLACGDNMGGVSLYQWPAWSVGAECYRHNVHAGLVLDIVFTSNDTLLFAVAEDGSVSKWAIGC